MASSPDRATGTHESVAFMAHMTQLRAQQLNHSLGASAVSKASHEVLLDDGKRASPSLSLQHRTITPPPIVESSDKMASSSVSAPLDILSADQNTASSSSLASTPRRAPTPPAPVIVNTSFVSDTDPLAMGDVGSDQKSKTEEAESVQYHEEDPLLDQSEKESSCERLTRIFCCCFQSKSKSE